MIGKLDKRVVIEERLLADNEQGETIESYRFLACCWAAAQYQKSASEEQINDGVEFDYLSMVFTIRHRDGITPLHRICYKNEAYDIESIEPIGRNNYLNLHARRKK